MSMIVEFWGTRGSISAPHPDLLSFGNHTTCLVVENEQNNIIIDAGFGIGYYSQYLKPKGNTFHLLLTHFHWDHIQGFQYFFPIFIPNNIINIYSPFPEEQVREILNIYFDGSYGPFDGLSSIPAEFRVHRMTGPLAIESFTVDFHKLNHTNLTYGYKISSNGGTIACLFDHDARSDKTNNDAIVKWAQGSDLVVHDAMFTEEEYREKSDWGHSTFEDACKNGVAINAETLLLTHHDPRRLDSELARIERQLQQTMEFENVEIRFAKEKQKYPVGT